MKIKFTEEDWETLSKVKIEKGYDTGAIFVAFYRIAAEKASFTPDLMINLGKKYRPGGFRVTKAFEDKLVKFAEKQAKRKCEWIELINLTPSTLDAVGWTLQDDEVEVDVERCFE